MTGRLIIPRLLIALLLVLPRAACSGHWYVPSEACPSIQTGIEAALDGDTVHVAAGRYHERLVWPYRNGIALIGAGADSTIVLGDDFEVVLFMLGSVPSQGQKFAGDPQHARLLATLEMLAVKAAPMDSTTLVQGIRFRGGHDAGVAISGASPALVDCAMDSTTAGPGLYSVLGASPSIRSCAFENNVEAGLNLYACPAPTVVRRSRFVGNQRSGVYLTNSTLRLVEDTLRANSRAGVEGVFSSITADSSMFVENLGAAVIASSSSLAMDRDSLLRNTSGLSVSGYPAHAPAEVRNSVVTGVTSYLGYVIRTALVLTDCHVHDNSGYGFYCLEDSIAFTRVRFEQNRNNYEGGAFSLSGCVGTIRDASFIGNSSASNGGAFTLSGGQVNVLSSIFSGNSAQQQGGCICMTSARAFVSGNQFMGNHASMGGALYANALLTCTGNRFLRNDATDGGGLYLNSSDSLMFRGNLVAENVAAARGGGLYVAGAGTSNWCLENTLVRNLGGSLGDAMFTTNSAPVVLHNSFEQNGYGVYNADLLGSPDVRNNWWGEATGPWSRGVHPQGLGDSLSTYVTSFDPWLGTPDTVAPPVPPRGLALLKAPGQPLQIHWNPVPLADLDHYRVYVGHGSAGAAFDSSFDTADTCAFLSDLPPDTTRRFAVTAIDHGGDESWYSREIASMAAPLAATPVHEGTTTFRLGPGTPNPFREVTGVAYALSRPGHARLDVFDPQGRRIVTLAQGYQSAGAHRVRWEGRDEAGNPVRPGVYLVRLWSDEGALQSRLVRLD